MERFDRSLTRPDSDSGARLRPGGRQGPPRSDRATSQYFWPERGIRIEIRDGKVHFLVYFDRFPDCICGIWIGAHAWEVDQVLGRAKAELFFSTGRIWQYDID